MEILEFFENIRTPFLNAVFSLFTRFGEEYAFLLVSLVMLWCVNKKYGYCLLFCGMLGQTANNFLKFHCKVPRPWIANPNFEPVKNAVSAASGYSFPSGHTQIAMTNYCTVAYFYRNKPAVCFSMLFITVMVAISRLYLGVHYFSDVMFSVLLGLIIVLAVCKMFEKNVNSNVFRISSILFSLSLLIYVIASVNITTVNEYELHSLEFSIKFFGASIAFALSWYLDEVYIKYTVKGSFIFQTFKLLVGFVLVIILRFGIKELFIILNINSFLADGIRYFILVMFAGAIWPYIFNKIHQKIKQFGTNC